MKPIIFSQHALDQLKDRGASEEEIIKAIQEKQVMPIVVGIRNSGDTILNYSAGVEQRRDLRISKVCGSILWYRKV